MDEADAANIEMERDLQRALARQAEELKRQSMPHIGSCFCGDEEGKRYCGVDCRDLAERHARSRRINGAG